ncbi:hypothetical protein TNCV_182921 [Trichonephila clavipes]|nr:hypothetical protein TNCV_182921 [Trichonephila clavipes]
MSSFLVLCEGNTRNRWRDGQVCPDVDKELWRLGPDGSGKKKKGRERRPERENEEKSGENGRKENGEETREDRRDGWRKGLSPKIGVKKTMNAGGVENGNMN